MWTEYGNSPIGSKLATEYDRAYQDAMRQAQRTALPGAPGGGPMTAPPVGRFGTTDYFPEKVSSADYTTGVAGRTGTPFGINSISDLIPGGAIGRLFGVGGESGATAKPAPVSSDPYLMQRVPPAVPPPASGPSVPFMDYRPGAGLSAPAYSAPPLHTSYNVPSAVTSTLSHILGSPTPAYGAEVPLFHGQPIGGTGQIGKTVPAAGRFTAFDDTHPVAGYTVFDPHAPDTTGVKWDQTLGPLASSFDPGVTQPVRKVVSSLAAAPAAGKLQVAAQILHALGEPGAGLSAPGGTSAGSSGASPWTTRNYIANYLTSQGVTPGNYIGSTPSGYTAPNFNPKSGGSIYSYKSNNQGGGTYTDSQGRTHSY
jgi:hypothetical protein